MAIINLPSVRACVCLYTCATCLSVCTHASATVGYTSTSQGHCREPGGRGDQWTMTLALQGMLLLKGQLRTINGQSEEEFKLFTLSFLSR